jgi:hypothetical protein
MKPRAGLGAAKLPCEVHDSLRPLFSAGVSFDFSALFSLFQDSLGSSGDSGALFGQMWALNSPGNLRRGPYSEVFPVFLQGSTLSIRFEGYSTPKLNPTLGPDRL